MESPPRSRQSLDHAIVQGVAWTGVASWVTQILTWVSTLLVVRLLRPDDYGIVALAALYLGLITMLSEFGLGLAVVTLRDLSSRQIAQLNSVALLLSLVAMILSWVCAVPIAVFMDSPRLVTLIRVMSIGLVVTALGTVPAALLRKQLRFRFLAGAQVAQSLLGAITTLVLAVVGAGYWALALGPLVGLLVLNLMVVAQAPCEYLMPDWGLRKALRFSRSVILEVFCWYLYTSADRVIIGRMIGEAAVGLYSVAQSFGMLAVEKVSVVLLRVAPSAFAEVQSEASAVRRYLLSMTEGLAIVTFPLSIGIALVAGDTVRLLFGEAWSGAITPLRILAVFAAYQSVTVLISRALAAVGEVRYLMHVGMLTLGTLPIGFMLGARWGLAGVAAVWALIYPLTQLPLFLRLRKRINLGAREYLGALWPAASAALLMAIGLFFLKQWEPVANLPLTARLALRVCVGATIYSIAILVFHSGRVRAIKTLMSDLRSREGSSPGPVESDPEGVDRPRLVG